MDFKKETKKLLESLSEQGFTQVKIAKLLGYGGKSISQIQNKGGTESLYNAIFLFSDYVRLKKSNNEQIDIIGQDNKSGAQSGANSDHRVGKLNLAGLKISEADRELLGVLSSLIEDGFSEQSSKLDKMKDEILAEIQKGNATAKSKGNKGQ